MQLRILRVTQPANELEHITVGAQQSRQRATLGESLAREVTLFGTYDEAPEQIAAWLAAGADSVQLVLPPGRPEEELAEIVEVAAAAERIARR